MTLTTIIILLVLISIVSGIVAHVIDVIERHEHSTASAADVGSNFALGFFLWPLFLPLGIIYGFFQLIRILLEVALHKPVVSIIKSMEKRKNVSAKPFDPFLEEAKRELRELENK